MEDVAHRPVASGRDLDASSRDRLSVKTERQHGGCHGGPVTLVGPGQAGGGGTLTGGTPPPKEGRGMKEHNRCGEGGLEPQALAGSMSSREQTLHGPPQPLGGLL